MSANSNARSFSLRKRHHEPWNGFNDFPLESVVPQAAMRPILIAEKGLPTIVLVKTAMMWTRDRGIGTRSNTASMVFVRALFRCKRAHTPGASGEAANGGAGQKRLSGTRLCALRGKISSDEMAGIEFPL